ncbi:hypothetical protein OMCYN_01764 [cyanobiont of Ornithocercus magnificus]|nr:hypothetical protein OMCYN_01764 [cyanobiont of Ornithocercus magnificus]
MSDAMAFRHCGVWSANAALALGSQKTRTKSLLLVNRAYRPVTNREKLLKQAVTDELAQSNDHTQSIATDRSKVLEAFREAKLADYPTSS